MDFPVSRLQVDLGLDRGFVVGDRRLREVLGDSYRAPDAAELVRRTCDWPVATRRGRRPERARAGDHAVA